MQASHDGHSSSTTQSGRSHRTYGSPCNALARYILLKFSEPRSSRENRAQDYAGSFLCASVNLSISSKFRDNDRNKAQIRPKTYISHRTLHVVFQPHQEALRTIALRTAVDDTALSVDAAILEVTRVLTLLVDACLLHWAVRVGTAPGCVFG